MRKIFLLLVAILLLSTFILAGCASEQKAALSSTTPATSNISFTPVTGDTVGFGIYLVDSGELVLSNHDIKAYHQFTHTIELNKQGIERWNSFHTYTGIPKLAGSLYGKDFVIKLEGEEMYRGKFYSCASSLSYSGVTIMDLLFKLDSTHNTINIQFGYPNTFDAAGQDPRDNPTIINYFAKCGLLK